MKKKLLLAAVIAGAIGVLAGCGTKEIDLSKYLDVQFSGIDGKGYVTNYTVDKDKLEDAIREANDDLSNKEREKLMDSVELELKEFDELSNGDKVKIDIDWSERKAERCGIKFISDEAEVEVTGLKEMKKIDAFKDIKIEYDGESPYLTIDVDNESDNEFLKKCYYDVEYPDDNYYAKIGDKITITVNYSEYDSEQSGYVPKEDSTEIEVKASDADAYLDSADQVSDEELKTLAEAAKEAIEDDVYDGTYSYTSMMKELTGQTYGWDFDMSTVNKTADCNVKKVELYKRKDAEDTYYYNYNYVILVMEHQISDAVNAGGATIYYAVEFSNAVRTAEGELDVDEDDARVLAYANSIENLDKTLLEKKYEEDEYEKSEVSK